jgi:hypothetical protein
MQCNTLTYYVFYLNTDVHIGLSLYIVAQHCKFLFLFIYFVCFVLLYDHDMFHIPLSCDSLRDLWNEYMYVCMYMFL